MDLKEIGWGGEGEGRGVLTVLQCFKKGTSDRML